jgi:hypothetical protein
MMNCKEDEVRFSTAIGVMCATLPPRDVVTKILLLGYDYAMSDLPIERIEYAVSRAMRECRFTPSPAELRGLAGEQTIEQQAIMAYDALRYALENHGTRSIDFCDDLPLNATVRSLGGWDRLRDVPCHERDKWYRPKFIRTYSQLAQTALTPELTAPLIHARSSSEVPIMKIRLNRQSLERKLTSPEEIEVTPHKMLSEFRPDIKKP